MAQAKRRIFAGDTCDQIVYGVSDGAAKRGKYNEYIRFETEEQRRAFNFARGLRKFIRLVNANFGPTSYYCTLTFDDEHECHTFDEARKVRDRFFSRLRYHWPEARIVIVMGRGKSTGRIHLHMLADGITEDAIRAQWRCGEMTYIQRLRAHNRYGGVDYGCDYTSLATYLYKHWTPEQGGHHYKATRNCIQPERDAEKATLCKRVYRPDKPPRAPKGFKFVGVIYNQYGYICYHYVRDIKALERALNVSL